MKLNNIKDSFENRKIKPSASAWDQLASRLDQEEKKDKKPVIYWLGAIAAALVFGFFLYPLVTNQIDGAEKQSELVIEDKKITWEKSSHQNKEVIPQDIITKENEIVLEENGNTKKSISSEKTSSRKKSNFIDSKEKLSNNKTGTNSARATADVVLTAKDKIKNNYIPEDNSINPAIANAKTQNKAQTLTSDQEMELLLSKALENVRLKEVAGKEINTDRLLRETEWDIEADRRNRVNDIIYDQLGKLKSEAYTLIGGNK
ncbi:hypothetical protein [Nonlabens sp.]|uniref:hypothetical protein n=1 Tax=Nonlabens sp. TaxID=1888209 RepID=UPI001BCFED92|nr:hypothetical protein [Nonlabens sp.]